MTSRLDRPILLPGDDRRCATMVTQLLEGVGRRTLHMREPLPERRRSWTQRVRIEGQTVYLTVGEYQDGRPGEVFIDVAKQGTFLRGVMGSLARMVSISLQCGSGVDVVVQALRGLDYPPSGQVEGSADVQHCVSVTDWIASELEARYIRPVSGVEDTVHPAYQPPGKVFGAHLVGSGV